MPVSGSFFLHVSGIIRSRFGIEGVVRDASDFCFVL